jgi:predicted RNA-binding Zn-ribbon protein involved in translation (DUF1610 family)
MTENQSAQRRHSSEETVRFNCPKCRAAMNQIPYVPGLGHLANRIFKCSACGNIEIDIERGSAG